LASRLEGLGKYGDVREVRGRGLFRGVELVRDTAGMEPFPELGRALKKTALESGVILRVDPTWFAVGPALTCGRDEIDELVDLTEGALVKALEAVS
ncbi:MAG: aspartate aminotransferase family protein, partial [Gemmatimonadetes bacterium]|nr:aspartate aminotransferase family protein [Gemmatimonadota bacterium]